MGWDFLLRSKFVFSSLVNREREITFFEFVTDSVVLFFKLI